MEGFIQLHRQLLDWERYDDINTKVLFIHLLLKANRKDKEWRGQIIKRGSFITGRIILSEETGLTEQQIRTSLDKLKTTNEITIKTTNKNSIVTILNYDKYQSDNRENNQQVTNKQPTSNQQTTTTNKDNNRNKEIILETTSVSLEELMKQNIDIESFVLEYNSNKENILKELKAFYLYWSEKKQNGKKERWQMEKTFDVGRRFHKRMSNSGKWDIGKKQNMVIVDF